MRNRHFMWFLLLILIVFLLFDVRLNFNMVLPSTIKIADEAQELLYLDCIKNEDRIIHQETFSLIDNPDVQREVLITKKERAARNCRAKFPLFYKSKDQAFQFNLIDFEYRY